MEDTENGITKAADVTAEETATTAATIDKIGEEILLKKPSPTNLETEIDARYKTYLVLST